MGAAAQPRDPQQAGSDTWVSACLLSNILALSPDRASLRHRPHPGGQRQPPGGCGEAPGLSQPVGEVGSQEAGGGGRGTMATVSSRARCQVSLAVGTQVLGRSLGLALPPTSDWDLCLLNPGMTQTPTTMWSVSRWAATATRSATSFCSGNIAGFRLTSTREAAMSPRARGPSPQV